ncbi:unnamed protein product [Trichogramma brassicae]|uniref:Ionotropic glutamate receptor L-glutamate and glycine-binding domain-containing protein n=1 Tax=Trichogramma brassicae TaxID=86971 RepID=A0A6H5IKU2_9HYME|nr:unnamed protein product [Trichogramma brassicae]
MDLKYYHNKINDPLLFIVIQSKRDFRLYANLTRNLKPTAKTFRVIMIFEKGGRICHDPPGNPLNLVFDSKVLVKCHDSEIISEWYSIYPNKTETDELVRWYRNEEHRRNEYLTDTLFRDRRQDLGGLNIRVTAQKENADKDGKIRGMCYDLMTEIARRINFTIDWQHLESKIGTYDPKTNTSDGILGKLASNKTDIGLGLFGLTADRLKLFDFSMPLVETRISYFIRRSNNNVYDFMSYSAIESRAARGAADLHKCMVYDDK